MRGRCKREKNYAGRGIRVCQRWQTFEHFFEDMGPRPTPKHTIERKDNDGDYTPKNCIWVLRKVQANNKRTNRWVVVDGQRLTLKQAVEGTGINYFTVLNRIRSGWSVQRALSTPPRPTRRWPHTLPS
jgi:hypothetical protein